MKSFKIQVTEVLIYQATFAVEAETEEEARTKLFRSAEQATQISEKPEYRRGFFDEELAPGLREMADFWECHLTGQAKEFQHL
jgi:hypothetical protein